MTRFDRRTFLESAALGAAAVLSSKTLLAAEEAKENSAKKKQSLRILFFGGELPLVEKELKEKYEIESLRGGQVQDKKEDNVTGLEQLATADLWIGSVSKRTFPSDVQLKHFQDYLAAGKPFVGYRAASHVFQNWLQVDKKVFGAKYGGHHLLSKDPELVISYAEGAQDHAILKGLDPPRPASGSYHYTEVAPDVQVLLNSGLEGDMMPHTWVRTIEKTGNRVFYTRYDAKELAENAVVREIFLRGIAWAAGGKG